MIDIHTEQILFDKIKVGNSFNPSRNAFIVIEKGSINIEVNEKLLTYNSGRIAFIIPNNIYKINSFTEDIKIYFVIIKRDEINNKISFVFSRYEMMRAVRNSYNAHKKPDKNSFLNIIRICELLYFYKKQETKTEYAENIKMGLLTSLIYILAASYIDEGNPEGKEGKSSRKEEITMTFLQLINSYAIEYKELKFYADELLISVKYLSNSVRAITGEPPSKFIVGMVLYRAKILILNSNMSIKEIAVQLKFSDQYAFGKFFKKQTGLSPSNYKKHNKLVAIK